MDGGERQRSAYRKILRALDEAIFCLEREPPEDPDLLLRWLGLRLAAAESVTGSFVSSQVGGAHDHRSGGELDDGARFLRCERSTRRARNFGAGIARRDMHDEIPDPAI